MFDFKYKESVEECFSLLNIVRIPTTDAKVIDIKTKDELIDLSPCVGIYQEAVFFNGGSYNIDKEIDLYAASHFGKNGYSDEIRQSSLDNKILYLTFLQTKQYRYRNQVETPFVNDSEKAQIIKRLSSVFTPDDNVQVFCQIPFANEANGHTAFSAIGYADVVKNDIVYELKFVSEMSHEHFLQCACYMVALKLQKGILWNTRNNTQFEISIPNVDLFLDAVARTITKKSLSKYCNPIINTVEKECSQSNFAVIDTETNWNDQVMSIGVVLAEPNEFKIIDTKYYILAPECLIGGMYSGVLKLSGLPNKKCSRNEAIKDIRSCFNTFGVSKIFAYNAVFDYNHLPELSEYIWHDIMKIAAYKKYNPKIPINAACYGTGRLKSNYGVEPIMRMLSGNTNYIETHNALSDAVDELKIMQLLEHKLEIYDCTVLKSKTPNPKQARHTYANTEPNSFSDYSDSDCCSAADAAVILGVSKGTVYNLIHQGLLVAIKKGSKYIIKKSDIHAYIGWKQEQQRKAAITTLAVCGAVGAFILIFLVLFFLGL